MAVRTEVARRPSSAHAPRAAPSAPRRIVALVSAAGGGDTPPVIALSLGLRERGHRVTVVCDASTSHLLRGTNLDTIVVPPELEFEGFFATFREQLKHAKLEELANPLETWGELCHPAVADLLASRSPDLIVSTLFCMGLADALSESIAIPWCFVNPAFYFGENQARSWEEDYYGPRVQEFFERCLLPLSQRADVVLHATDRAFDTPPPRLPLGHHYSGFLLWEPREDLPDFVEKPGAPWALVTVSTVPQADEIRLARAAAWALAAQPVRTLLTLPYERARREIGALPSNARVAGFVPHGRVLGHCSLVITHAGHGIVSKALHHGVPMVLLPWDRDQPGVAYRAVRLGVGERIEREDVDPALVSDVVSKVLRDSSYRTRAARVSSRLQSVDAVSGACRILEEALAG